MAWSGGSYTKGNAGTGGWAGDASAGIGIEAGRHDIQDNDFATGINQCINKDGSNSFTANPNLGGFIPTNLGAGTVTAPALCVGNDVNTGIFGPAADTWAVATNGTEAFRVDSSQRVGVGNSPFTSAQFYASATPSFRVAGRFYQAASGDVGTPAINLDKYDNNSTTSQVFLQATINQQSAGCGQINANGASQLAFGTYSDARLKENVTPLPSQLASILALKPCEFDYKDGSGHQIGFIAQEVQTVYPDLVGQRQDGMLTVSGLGKLEARLIKAIQELSVKVEALESQLSATTVVP
jgi:hypothetical protein